ncbi:hypothetical protein MYMAC_002880 [Corallococcus macrosporus DSM 14697]|uniref:Uncharacterized protein n=1 Tax=Corallococcus macrosporus DSM 14697 TaxID=1189310 RepID=A0A250JUX8_9BACT|nr:hypothetical protein MYMAC_002880 [Corallococcus macrosporus DSM 14697]
MWLKAAPSRVKPLSATRLSEPWRAVLTPQCQMPPSWSVQTPRLNRLMPLLVSWTPPR